MAAQWKIKAKEDSAVKESIKIASIFFALLSVVCLCASCSEKQTRKEVFHIFRECDNAGFNPDTYINTVSSYRCHRRPRTAA